MRHFFDNSKKMGKQEIQGDGGYGDQPHDRWRESGMGFKIDDFEGCKGYENRKLNEVQRERYFPQKTG